MEKTQTPSLPRPFIFRRLHSLFGLWLVIYLIEHLFINSQAALFFFDEGHRFIALVNRLESMPYLLLIEWIFLAIPFLVHGIWGVLYLRTSKNNAKRTDGHDPALGQYERNRAYRWQRITSWVLLIGIILHVIQMRFLDRPLFLEKEGQKTYSVKVVEDPGLNKVVSILGATLSQDDKGHLIATLPHSGGAFFLMVREIFKSPSFVVLYSVFVLAAVYHAFNGVWTFMISWGITLSRSAQKRMRLVTTALMFLVAGLGLFAAWGTYLTTLLQ